MSRITIIIRNAYSVVRSASDMCVWPILNLVYQVALQSVVNIIVSNVKECFMILIHRFFYISIELSFFCLIDIAFDRSIRPKPEKSETL